MRITMIGHATLFFETADCRILFDPVLWDPHQEGLLDVYPRREVSLENLPEPDLLVLSHRHLDHFDLRSLAHLPRSVDVFLPEDPFLAGCLRRLGYTHVHPLAEFAEVTLGGTRLLTTRSELRVPELGFVVADETAVCWNAVDSLISPETIARVAAREPRIDLFLAAWQPMLEVNFHWHRSLAFPFERYRVLVENVLAVAPRVVVPGANGFRYTGAASWLNRVVFPVTRERFLSDLVAAGTTARPLTLDPGDVLEIDGERVEHRAGESTFVRTLERHPGEIDFRPVEMDNTMVDENPDGHGRAELAATVEAEVGSGLPAFLTAHRDTHLREHVRFAVIYQLEVVFPGGERQTWSFDLTAPDIVAQPGRNPLATLFTAITASSLYGLVHGTRGWDYASVGGFCRRYQKLYGVAAGSLVDPEGKNLKDPLRFRFPDDAVFEAVTTRELEGWLAKRPPVPATVPARPLQVADPVPFEIAAP